MLRSNRQVVVDATKYFPLLKSPKKFNTKTYGTIFGGHIWRQIRKRNPANWNFPF